MNPHRRIVEHREALLQQVALVLPQQPKVLAHLKNCTNFQPQSNFENRYVSMKAHILLRLSYPLRISIVYFIHYFLLLYTKTA